MKTYFRDILVFSETGDDRQVFNRDRIEVISKAAGRMSKQELLNSMKVINARSGRWNRMQTGSFCWK